MKSFIKNSLATLLQGSGLLSSAVRIVSTQVGIIGVNMLTGVITARSLGADGRGLFAIITIWPQLLAAVGLAGLPLAIIYLGRKESSRRAAVFGASLILCILLIAAAMCLGLLIAPLAVRTLDRSAIIVLEVCILFTWVNGLIMVLRQICLSLDLISAFNISSWGPPVVYLALLGGLVATNELNYWSACYALVVSGAPTVIYLLIKLYPCLAVDKSKLKDDFFRLGRFSLLAAPSEVVSAVSTYADRLILLMFVTPAAIGLYAVAYTFSRLLMIVPGAVTSLLLPRFAELDKPTLLIEHAKAVRITVLLVTTGALCMLLGDRFFITLLYGPDFSQSVLIFRILLAEAAFSCIATMLSQIFNALGRPGLPSVIQTVSFFSSVGGMFFAVPRFGSEGAAAALLASGILRVVLSAITIPAVLQIPLPSLRFRLTDFRRNT